MQRTEVDSHDELRRKLLVDCRTCVRTGVLVAAMTGGTLTNIALNGVKLSAIAKLGIDAAATIAVALIAVTQWDGLVMARQSQRTLGIIRSSTQMLITFLTGELSGHVDRMNNQDARIADLENQLGRSGQRIAALEQQQIHPARTSFFGRLWGH